MTEATEDVFALGGILGLMTPGAFVLPFAFRYLLESREYLSGTLLLLPFVCGFALYLIADHNKGKRIRSREI